jgi:hypothetical protein
MSNPRPVTVPPTRPPLVAIAFIVSLLSLVCGTSGCGGEGGDGLAKATAALRLSAAPVASPEVIDIGCDVSKKSPCIPTTLGLTMDKVLPYAAARPGSHVRLWQIGRDVSDVVMVAEQLSPLPPKTKKSTKAAREKWVETTAKFFLKAAEPMFLRKPVNRSPLFEAISKVALSEVPGISTRVLIVLTDGLEVSGFADWEQGDLVPIAELAKQLHAERVLSPGVLKDTRVFLSYADISRASKSRDRSSITRLTTITDGWRQLLREAGATDVVITNGVAPLSDRTAD